MIDIDKHLISYHDGGNDYRYVFSRDEVVEIKKALEFYESALKNEDGYLATMCERNGYNKAIDDFVKFANTMPTVEEDDGTIRPMWLEEMAERLKEQNK